MVTNISQRCLGIIPARGGSKGVRRKNIRTVGSHPLIWYTIEAAKKSHFLSRFVVSTEDPEIAEVAENFGAAIVQRPHGIAQDDTPMVPVLQHALDASESDSTGFDWVVILQPTTPLRASVDIDNAIKLAIENNADSVVSVYAVEDHHPARMYTIADNLLVPFWNEPKSMLRQELPELYHRNGAVYVIKRSVLTETNSIFGQTIIPYIMPRERSINIDDELDLKFADYLLAERGEDDAFAKY